MTKINYADIELAEGGFIVEWSEKPLSLNSFDHCEHVNKKKVFTSSQENKAWDFYKEKKMECLKAKDSSEY